MESTHTINEAKNQRKELTCEFCGYEVEPGEYFDKAVDGWWCEVCDAFNLYSEQRNTADRFIVLLEDKGLKEPARHIAPIKFKKNLSPLRYPGAKSKLIDYLYSHLADKKCKTLYSAFSGGSSFEFALLEAGIVDKIVLNDLDYGIYSLLWTMLYAPFILIERLKQETPTSNDYYTAQQHLKDDGRGLTMGDAAWYTLVVNRLAFSGIAKANHLGGKNGTRDQMLSRWNPTTLIKRIESIHRLADKIEVHCEDAVSFIEEAYWDNFGTIFIDPPYIEKGKILYHHYYNEEDHYRLSTLLDSLYWGCSGADILVTYDNHQLTKKLFHQATERKVIGRQYSI